jgi:hypothetical protein
LALRTMMIDDIDKAAFPAARIQLAGLSRCCNVDRNQDVSRNTGA